MKKLFLLAILLLGFSVVAMAQDVPAVEIFGGYSYMRCDVNENELAIADEEEDLACNMNGWNFSAAINANKFVGAVIDMSGHYGSVGSEGDAADARIHSLMFGPKFTMRSGIFTPFAQALVGLSSVRASFEEGDYDFSYTETDFAMVFGGGLDINVHDRVTVRPIQVEYFPIRSGNRFLDNLRYSAGLVIKLGNR